MWELIFFATERPLKLRSVAHFYTNVVNTNRALRTPNSPNPTTQRNMSTDKELYYKILPKYDLHSFIYCDFVDERLHNQKNIYIYRYR